MSSIKTVLEVQRLEPAPAKSVNILSEYTPVRLHTFLKYVRINPDFLIDPASFPRTLNFISKDLARSGLHKSNEEICAALEYWKERISYSDPACLTRPMDRELKRLLVSIESRLTHSQITLILQHLEVVGSNSQTLWPTIAVEMKALKFSPRPEIYWRRSFEQWCQEARKRYEDDPDGLSSLQQRYIDFLRERDELEQTAEENAIDALELVINHCRTCLETLKIGNSKVYLFEAMGVGTTLADKINMCFGSGIEIQERLPKYVCEECVKKVEVAYALKMQIDRTDEDLKSLMAEYSRKSNNVQEEAEEQVDILEETEIPVASTAVMSEQIQANENSDVEFQSMVVEMTEERDDISYDDNEQQSDSKSEEKYEEKLEIVANTQYYFEPQEETDTIIKEEEEHKFSISMIEKTDDSSDNPVKPSKKSRNKIVPEIDKGFYRCNQCRTVLRTRELWRAHTARHASEKQHVCSTCSKQFRSASTLKVHLRTHTNERPYVCDICNKRFAQNTNLAYHMKVHQNIRDFPCELCPYRARSQNDLNLHQRKHTGVRPYTCDVCQCSFTTSSNLNKHVKRRHMGERNYKVCGKAFRTYSQIKAHGHVHRPDDRPVKCNHCSYTTSTKSSLIIHLRSHVATKPYICTICDARFGTSSNMHKHVRSMHEKLKPFKCEECGKTFTTKETVQKHMVTHNGTKPYSCPECMVRYSWYNGLQKHMKLIHPGAHIPTEKTLIDEYNETQKRTTVHVKTE